MSVEQSSATERVQGARERYVARGIATPPLGNVIRILVPFAIEDADLEGGLDILQECLGG